jgi:hypothetical protein
MLVLVAEKSSDSPVRVLNCVCMNLLLTNGMLMVLLWLGGETPLLQYVSLCKTVLASQ